MCILHVGLCISYVPSSWECQKRAWTRPELELLMVVSCYVSSGKLPWFLCKSSQCANHWVSLPSPQPFSLLVCSFYFGGGGVCLESSRLMAFSTVVAIIIFLWYESCLHISLFKHWVELSLFWQKWLSAKSDSLRNHCVGVWGGLRQSSWNLTMLPSGKSLISSQRMPPSLGKRVECFLARTH